MHASSVLVRDADPLVVAEPTINLIPAMLIERLGCPVLAVCGQQVPVSALLRQHPLLQRYLGRHIVVGVRPEHLQDAVVRQPAVAGPAALVLHGVVRLVRPAGPDRIVELELADGEGCALPAPTVVARVSGCSNAAAGEPIMLAVGTRHMLVFDAHSGRSLW
ncbi:TOBE domain-containing protein [Dactylosporangium roseum]|uniref:TOBE domain-containing protein n=1 Tax=Dactylosporangium roseum TaxID=47989 RepID=A0ABY5Z0N4_9ACTN|nr:TOBE domain-containing protein [Dactylosporangium roseum]UWZ34338.1 TOBE domain-containing protein [Dactylosporangium roseum]